MNRAIPILLLCVGIFASCSKNSSDHEGRVETVDSSDIENPFATQSEAYFEIYKVGNPESALQAMFDEAAHITNAPEADISRFWKHQALAFTETRIFMILESLGRHEEASTHIVSALDHINTWMTEAGRGKIDQ